MNVTTARVEEAVRGRENSPQATSSDGNLPFTPRAKKALEMALREALSLGHNFIDTEHMMLGLLRVEEGPASEVLDGLGVDTEFLRDSLIERAPPRGHRIQSSGKQATSDPIDADSEPRPEPSEATSEPTSGPIGEPVEAIPTHSDRPAMEDELGRERLAQVLGERIRRVRGEDTEARASGWRERRRKRRRDASVAKVTGSFMVHVYAPWGAGKSSLLRFLASDLRSRRGKRTGRTTDASGLSQWIVVDFSAWQHQRLVAPWWWLLASMQRACSRELWQISWSRWAWFWVRDAGWRIWNARAVVFAAALLFVVVGAAWLFDWFGLTDQPLTAVQAALLTVTAAIALSASIVGMSRGAGRWLAIGSAEGAVRFLRRSHDPLGVYRRRFRWLVRSSGRPISVFIDDLDRCKPEYVVELLEGIQTLFSSEPVTYVVAADRNWLCESFANVYGEFQDSIGEPGRPLGYLFLEKTFQISLEIPPLSDHDRERYWQSLMSSSSRHGGGRDDDGDARPAVSFAGAATQAEVEQRVGAMLGKGEDDEVLAAAVRRLNAPDLEGQQEMLLSEFAPLMENNPRSMKRLLNAYGIERDRLLLEGHILTKKERRQLALLTILRLRWPQLAEHLGRNPDEAKYCSGRGREVSPDHPFQVLFGDAEVSRLFDGSHVEERLEARLLGAFPPRSNGGSSGSAAAGN